MFAPYTMKPPARTNSPNPYTAGSRCFAARLTTTARWRSVRGSVNTVSPSTRARAMVANTASSWLASRTSNALSVTLSVAAGGEGPLGRVSRAPRAGVLGAPAPGEHRHRALHGARAFPPEHPAVPQDK